VKSAAREVGDRVDRLVESAFDPKRAFQMLGKHEQAHADVQAQPAGSEKAMTVYVLILMGVVLLSMYVAMQISLRRLVDASEAS
jgi:hypothetical protein